MCIFKISTGYTDDGGYEKRIAHYYYYYYYFRFSSLGPVRAETRAQSDDWYGSGTLRPEQILMGSLLLLSPAFRHSHFRHQVPPRLPRRERSPAEEGGTVGENIVR
jgi:hypothetical protein